MGTCSKDDCCGMLKEYFIKVDADGNNATEIVGRHGCAQDVDHLGHYSATCEKMETAAGRLRTAAWTMTMMMDTQFSRLRSVFAVRTDATMKTQFLRFQQRRLLLAVQDILLELSSQSYSLSFSKSEGIVLLLLCI